MFKISKKHFLLGLFIGLTLFFAYLWFLPDQKLHIVFCDVGQGDAAYIRGPNNMDMLIDGGPNNKVLNCLGRHMPFYDRTIDVVMLSHAQKDHMQGLLSVLQRYEVKYIITTPVGNETEGYKKFTDLIKSKKIPVKNLYQGDEFLLGEVRFKILWPNRDWLVKNTSILTVGDARGRSPNGTVLGLQSDTDLNSFSYFVHLNYGTFDALFTGDGDRKIQPEVMDTAELPDVEVLKFPHHGSKTGILSSFLDRIKPELAVISVGKNSYGHPSKEAINLLSNQAIEIKRTDREGDIQVMSDGNGWSINN